MKQKKLGKGGTIALIIGADLILLLMGWFLMLAPQRATAKSIDASIAAMQLQIADAKKPVVQPTPTAVQQPEIKTANLYNLAKAMPSSMDTPSLLLELSMIARESGVTLASVQPGQPNAAASATGFSTVPINLTFDGNFYSLTDLLYRLRSLVRVDDGELVTSGRLFSVDNVALTPSGVGDALTATATVDAYVYGGTPPAPPAPAAPAATDTGSSTTTDTTTTTPAADVAAGN